MLNKFTAIAAMGGLAVIVTACTPAPEPIRPEPMFDKLGNEVCDPTPVSVPPNYTAGTVNQTGYLPPCCPPGYYVTEGDDGPICLPIPPDQNGDDGRTPNSQPGRTPTGAIN